MGLFLAVLQAPSRVADFAQPGSARAPDAGTVALEQRSPAPHFQTSVSEITASWRFFSRLAAGVMRGWLCLRDPVPREGGRNAVLV